MVRHRRIIRCAQAAVSACLLIASIQAADRVKIQSGELEGVQEPGSGVRAFKGIPFAAPPVGPLRWKAPQPVASWTGIRKADEFGSRCYDTKSEWQVMHLSASSQAAPDTRRSRYSFLDEVNAGKPAGQ